MDLLLKAIATAGFVAGLLMLLRQAGPRASGLAAALPVTSAPALFWLGLEQGSGFAAHAATAALLTTALTPLLVTVYGRLSPRRGPLVCLLASLGAAGLGMLLLQPPQGVPVLGGLLLALALSMLALRLLPRPAEAAARRSRWRRELLLTAGTAGGLTLAIGLLAGPMGAGACGLLAAIPVVGLSMVCSMHRQQGAAVVCRFLVGYVDGIAAKAAFLALLAVALGALPLGCAWAAAACAGLLTLGLLRLPLLQRLHPATA